MLFFSYNRIHEILRTFYDRLSNDGDRKWLYEQIIKTSNEVLQENFHQLLRHLDIDKTGSFTEDNLHRLVYCDFAKPQKDQKHYLEVNNIEQLLTISEQSLEEFNKISEKSMNIVVFRYE